MTHSGKRYPNTMGCVDNILQQTRTPQLEELMVAIDVSPSMEEDDWPPTRLRGAQDAFSALLERKQKERPHDRVGLVTFAGKAKIESKPVVISAHLSILRRLARQVQISECTNIRAALAQAGAAFNGHSTNTASNGLLGWLWSSFFAENNATVPQLPQVTARRIILLTDGDHNTGKNPVGTAQRLKADGIEINCIGIGGRPKDVNEKQLKQIASRDPQGKPLYWFIGDRGTLIKKFESLATGLRCINT